MNLILLPLLLPCAAQSPQNPAELGLVRFERSVDAGLVRAKTEGRPAFVLFQEIPG